LFTRTKREIEMKTCIKSMLVLGLSVFFASEGWAYSGQWQVTTVVIPAHDGRAAVAIEFVYAVWLDTSPDALP